MPRDPRLREDLIATVLLALLLVAAFANVVFDGRSLVGSDSHNPLDYRMRGPHAVPIEAWTSRGLVLYPNFRDLASIVMQTDPSREFLRRSLRRGEFPFWDPYLGGGAPSFASLVPQYFFAPSLLVVLLGNGRVITNIYILLLIFTSGVLTYFLLRRHLEHSWAAFAGAFAFMLSGAVVMTASSVVGQPIPFFSLPLLVTVRLLDAPSPRRGAQLALAFAFVATATFPPVLLQVFGMAVVYLILSRPRFRTAAWFAAGAALSLAIVACIYLPAILLMAETTQIRDYYSHAAQAVLPVKFLTQILSAKIAGGVATYADPPVGIVLGEHMYYTGVAALFLAGVGALTRAANSRARALQLTALITIVLSVMKLIGLPPMQWLMYVPFLRNFHYASYLGIGIAYAVALLAALGVDSLLCGAGNPAGGTWPLIVSASLLAAWLIAVRVATRAQVTVHPNGARWIADWRLIVAFLILSAVLWWIVSRKPRSRFAVALLVLAAEGITNSAYTRPRRWDHWSHPPPYIQLMLARNSGGRVLPMPIFPANTESVFRLPTLDSILTASPRMYELYRRYFGPIPDVILRETTRIPPERVLDAANIEYFAIVSSDASSLAEAARRRYETLYADDYMHLIRRPTQPHYTFSSEYQVVNAQRALDALPTLPRDTVFLEQPPHFSPTVGPEVAPRILRSGLNESVIRIDALRPGMLVCSESNMHGWSATVDGHPAPILPANYAFRAVEIPPGSHTVHFAYDPPGWHAGLGITIAALLLTACGFWVGDKDTLTAGEA
jgi:hypothetical protein